MIERTYEGTGAEDWGALRRAWGIADCNVVMRMFTSVRGLVAVCCDSKHSDELTANAAVILHTSAFSSV